MPDGSPPASKHIGVFGGGQLGRMLVEATHVLGRTICVFDPSKDSPAGELADQHICADYSDRQALESFVGSCAAISTEFENIPLDAFDYAQERLPTSPDTYALKIAQDRIAEKGFVNSVGIKTVPYLPVPDAQNLPQCPDELFPAILKTSRLGYDGKGQRAVTDAASVAQAIDELGATSYVLEQQIDLKAELSVVLARSRQGEVVTYPPSDNVHRDGILHTSSVPSVLSDDICEEAQRVAVLIASKLQYCGVLAVEFFVDSDDQVLVNELAPRPHNSGHYTIDACDASQFEQQARVMCDMPLVSTQLHTPVVMVNLLGDLWSQGEPDWNHLTAHDNVALHLYGKKEARPGRKMGHFCVLGADREANQRLATELYEHLAQAS